MNNPMRSLNLLVKRVEWLHWRKPRLPAAPPAREPRPLRLTWADYLLMVLVSTALTAAAVIYVVGRTPCGA